MANCELCGIKFESVINTKKFCSTKCQQKHYRLHIDHITPISKAKTKEDVYKLNYYRNLQYLLAHDNLIKGAK